MYDTFKDMISQLYNNPDFIEPVYVEGRLYKGICSSIGNGTLFTDAGLVDQANFTIDLELATLDRIPNQGDKVRFREQQYKISHVDVDSANTTIKLYLIDLSKGK